MDILVVLSDGFEADLERAQGSSKSAAKGIIYIFATWVHFAPSSFHIWFHHTGHQFSKIQIVGMKRNLHGQKVPCVVYEGKFENQVKIAVTMTHRKLVVLDD
ncbi:hypothetical protein L1887_04501 [Cichorium endivia]|nr:hypothetical protein L1887_04501 [Cichorium endivia]